MWVLVYSKRYEHQVDPKQSFEKLLLYIYLLGTLDIVFKYHITFHASTPSTVSATF